MAIQALVAGMTGFVGSQFNFAGYKQKEANMFFFFRLTLKQQKNIAHKKKRNCTHKKTNKKVSYMARSLKLLIKVI